MCLVFTSAFHFGHAQKADAVKWMAGTWKINAGQGTIVEKWKIANDSTLLGKSVFVKIAGDSALQESLELTFRKGQWVYTSTVQGQNDNKPVSFKVIFLKGTEFISENPAHDFPQRIAYRRIKNLMYASIEGKNNGKFSKRNFDFTGE
ncbi:hypothetical protein WSM22_04490 [Cytophagales bacterium WSM2-2]|nr:hypothetical protein WSM22_04490 [Cytophagales bacterium WSM2-2]